MKTVFPFQEVPIVKHLDLDAFPSNEISYRWLHIVSNGIGQPILVPIMVAKGSKTGPVLGLTAAVHGNELNGISIIQRLFNEIDTNELCGTIVGVPVVNVPSVLLSKRTFIDGTDINRIMPGNKTGNRSQVYAARVIERIVKHFDYLLDLHTASFGRVNSYYIRADLSSQVAQELAHLQNPQIILNAPPKDGTLRGAAADLGIDAITIEVGDPNKFQKGVIRSSLTGIFNTLAYLEMYNSDLDKNEDQPVVCNSSKWIYSDRGGIISVHYDLTQRVAKGEKVATIRNIFGEIIKEFFAPYDGVVIGKSNHPVGQTGSRLIHLGKTK